MNPWESDVAVDTANPWDGDAEVEKPAWENDPPQDPAAREQWQQHQEIDRAYSVTLDKAEPEAGPLAVEPMEKPEPRPAPAGVPRVRAAEQAAVVAPIYERMARANDAAAGF